ncbi:hypothetical protein FNV43_RR01602 [Rhamnella rubrinervis]|uniref:Uncharacterized protein n=1 Tax=Rhamnella rubrinervis TaxID=2594499 RepID=A0A8K0HRT0_9ROSA|nr:hypothetical protein FNV43_RR01602 [Rhamnella rubrinervis]
MCRPQKLPRPKKLARPRKLSEDQRKGEVRGSCLRPVVGKVEDVGGRRKMSRVGGGRWGGEEVVGGQEDVEVGKLEGRRWRMAVGSCWRAVGRSRPPDAVGGRRKLWEAVGRWRWSGSCWRRRKLARKMAHVGRCCWSRDSEGERWGVVGSWEAAEMSGGRKLAADLGSCRGAIGSWGRRVGERKLPEARGRWGGRRAVGGPEGSCLRVSKLAEAGGLPGTRSQRGLQKLGRGQEVVGGPEYARRRGSWREVRGSCRGRMVSGSQEVAGGEDVGGRGKMSEAVGSCRGRGKWREEKLARTGEVTHHHRKGQRKLPGPQEAVVGRRKRGGRILAGASCRSVRLLARSVGSWRGQRSWQVRGNLVEAEEVVQAGGKSGGSSVEGGLVLEAAVKGGVRGSCLRSVRSDEGPRKLWEAGRRCQRKGCPGSREGMEAEKSVRP